LKKKKEELNKRLELGWEIVETKKSMMESEKGEKESTISI
jgi:hypothetical protein